jgi:VIT1/CCC1 family predicted Fe2+/Mn2+ transporter
MPGIILTPGEGGIVPMIPYLITIDEINKAPFVSIGITAVVLLIFGFLKATATGVRYDVAIYGFFETLLIGALAVSAAYGVVKAVDTHFNVNRSS